MKHTMITFQLHRRGVIVLALGAVFVGALLFAAGFMSARLPDRLTRNPRPQAKPVLHAAALATPAKQLTVPRTPAASAVTPAAAKPMAKSDAFSIRVAMFVAEPEAKAFVQELAARKIESAIVPIGTSSATVLYTVQAGRFATRDEAAAAVAALARDQGLNGSVVPAGLPAVEVVH